MQSDLFVARHTKIDYYIESFFLRQEFLFFFVRDRTLSVRLCFAVFSTFRHRESNSRTLQTRVPQISFHDFQKCKQIFSSDPHTKIDFFWFSWTILLNNFLWRQRESFCFVFFILWGFLPLLPRQDSGHKLSIGLVLKKWICSLTRLAIIWRFLYKIVLDSRCHFCSCRLSTQGKINCWKRKEKQTNLFLFLSNYPTFSFPLSPSLFLFPLGKSTSLLGKIKSREIYKPGTLITIIRN